MAGASGDLSPMLKVLVTGASGFVGRAICAHLQQHGYNVLAAARQAAISSLPANLTAAGITAIHGDTDWSMHLQDIDVVVHLAARVHVMQDTAEDPLAAFRVVNTAGTLQLARQAAAAKVKRFVFLSSIKVLGESSGAECLSPQTPAAPEDPYAQSKWEAEQGLLELARQTGMEVVILRPPLIYGPGVKGNFLRLISLVQQPLPLPFAAVANRRTLLYLANCCDLIRLTLEHPAAAGQILLMGDAEPIATRDLLRYLAVALQRPLHLWSVPVPVLKFLARTVGKGAEMDRLCDSLEVDIQATCQLLHWQPPFSVRQGLELTAQSFRKV